MEILTALNTRINKLVGIVLTACFTVMVVVIFFQVVFRYAFEHPLPWSEEAARYLFVWATFLGASSAFYDNTHINVTYFTDLSSNPRIRASIRALADIGCIWFLAVFVYYGFVVASRVHNLGQFSPSMEWLSIGAVMLAVPIGCLFMILNVLANLLSHIHTIITGQTVTLAHHNNH